MASPACLAAGWGWSAAYYQDLLTVSFGPERAISPVQPVIIRVIRPTSLSAAASCIRVNIRVIIRVMLLTSCHLCIKLDPGDTHDTCYQFVINFSADWRVWREREQGQGD